MNQGKAVCETTTFGRVLPGVPSHESAISQGGFE